MKNVKRQELICQRCDHKWAARNDIVTICPSCKKQTFGVPKDKLPKVLDDIQDIIDKASYR